MRKIVEENTSYTTLTVSNSVHFYDNRLKIFAQSSSNLLKVSELHTLVVTNPLLTHSFNECAPLSYTFATVRKLLATASKHS
tara:strand:+ start:1142 stop:1387 length:246 start_codon:yes stop_codon:yes gene_type:complete